MLEGVDRLIDLTGPRTAALSGAADRDVVAAVRSCDTAALAATDGHLAAIGRDGRTVRLARTIGIPMRYFVAKMYHGPFLVVSDRIDRLFDWCQSQRIGWQFDPIYTRMVPAHYVVELDQVGCPDPSPRYQRFFEPRIAQGSADVEEAGDAYIRAAYAVVRDWLSRVPAGERVGVAFSGGIDSTATLLMARHAARELGRDVDSIRAFTLDMGGGGDAAQGESAVGTLGMAEAWERVDVSPSDYDLEEAIRVTEDYHPLDVECAAAAVCLLRGIRRRHPTLTYL